MVGNAGFDPLGLSTPQNINWMREAEIKHGRMCMLAWSGYVMVDLGYTFPGAKYEGVSSFDAHDAAVSYELFLLLLWVGTFETIGFSQASCAEGPAEWQGGRGGGGGQSGRGRVRSNDSWRGRTSIPSRPRERHARAGMAPAEG